LSGCGALCADAPFNEMTALQDSLRSGFAYYRAQPQVMLKLLGSLWNPTTSAEA